MLAPPRRPFAPAALALLAATSPLLGCGDDDRPVREEPAPRVAHARDAVAEPAVFAALPHGWRQRSSGPAAIGRAGASTWTLATSWPYDGDPRGPATALPRGEVLVSVLLLRRHAGGRDATNLCRRAPISPRFPAQRHGDLALDRMTRGRLEGRRDVTEYRLLRSTPDYWIDLRVDVGGRRPSAQVRRDADRVLRVLLLPDWPNRCSP